MFGHAAAGLFGHGAAAMRSGFMCSIMPLRYDYKVIDPRDFLFISVIPILKKFI